MFQVRTSCGGGHSLLQALGHKSRGNDLYKARKFDEALEEYGKALELYDKDVSFLTNRYVALTFTVQHQAAV